MADADTGKTNQKRRAVIVTGPTAGGKSALAVDLAETLGGAVINADSMQVYAELRVLTARPSPAEEARAPHRLYGVLAASERCSAGRWARLARAEAEDIWASGLAPVFCGGTGFYLEALMQGLSPAPETPPEVREAVSARQKELGPEAFHAELAAADPETAARLNPGDRQRTARAMEIYQATGKPLSAWLGAHPPEGALAAEFFVIALIPPRETLYAAIDARFDAMLAAGAEAEVRALAALALSPALPAMKAHGVPEIAAWLAGNMTLEAASAQAKQNVRNYAKRQMTWLRHRLPGAHVISAPYSAEVSREILPRVRRFLLTA
ncbi:MAG: tRNA (adenosine(37)-N6)-dimethylallyltransferase MiaA [Rhodospirillales bacterium]